MRTIRSHLSPVLPGVAAWTVRQASPLRVLAALLTLGAAAIHFAVAPEHFQEYTLFGLFFVTVGGVQDLLAVLILVRPSRWLWLVGAEGTLVIVAIWLFSRAVEVPIGPAAGRPEAVGLPDAACTVLEVLTVLVFMVLALAIGRQPDGEGG